VLKITTNFNPDDLKRKVIDAAKKKMLANANRVAHSMRCSVHGKPPTVQPTSKGYDLSTCCEEFKIEVLKALKVK